MAQVNDTTGFTEVLQEISESGNPLLTMLRMICQEVMELEVSQRVGADRSERTGERSGYRSGHRDRNLNTRLGALELSIPKLRKGGYVPFFMERWQRSEQALVAAVHDIYVMGVSTRKVQALAESMGIEGISAAEVSNMSKKLDEQVTAFRKQDFTGRKYPILWVDAIYEKVRVDSRVVSMAIEIVCGVSTDGHREVLAIEPMAEESTDSYLALFRDMRARRLEVPRLIISDAHSGLVSAIQQGFPGASWQRCKVHFMRNILAHIPQKSKDDFARELKEIWLAKEANEARNRAAALCSKYRNKYPKAVECLENGLEDSLTFYAFPMIDPRKIASSNMIERLNKEIRRRTRVVGIFPNEASYVRLVCSYILEYAEDWSYERVYLSPESLRKMLEGEETAEADVKLDALSPADLDRTCLAG